MTATDRAWMLLLYVLAPAVFWLGFACAVKAAL